MKTLDKGQDKVKQIVRVLRDEALEPAKKEAEMIIEEAQKRADEIIKQAQQKAEQFIQSSRETITQERAVFQSSLQQSSKQAMESLRQSIETKLFNEELQAVLEKHTSDPHVIAQLINAFCKVIEKEGTAGNVIVEIAKKVPPQEVNALLLSEILKKLKKESVTVGEFAGGAKIRFADKKMTIDVSDQALKELYSEYMRKSFRKMIFGE